MRRLPFADGAFDGVFAFYVLHHVGEYGPALQEVARVLRPGGVFLFVDLIRPAWLPLPAS